MIPHHCLLLLAAIVMTGCHSQLANPVPVAVSVPASQPVEPIAPGDRPVQINGAKFYRVDEYLRIPKDLLPTGARVCLEGIVRGSGYVMGPPFVRLSTPGAEDQIQCEGIFDLDKIRFDVGTNVVVVGTQSKFASHYLVEATVVTQSQIDHALEVEGQPANALDVIPQEP